jgi:hypothetical protein
VRILWLKTELLHPVDKGGKIRSYQTLKELKQDHHVTYLTLDDGSAPSTAVEQAREYCQELVRVPHRTTAKFGAEFYSELAANLFSSLPYAIEKYASAGMRDEVAQRVEHGRFDVVVCDFLALAGNVPAGLCCPTVLFQHNVEAVIWRRLCEVQKNAVKKIYFREQWRKMRNFEAEMCRQFGAVVAVSTTSDPVAGSPFRQTIWCSRDRWIGYLTRTAFATSLKRSCRWFVVKCPTLP